MHLKCIIVIFNYVYFAYKFLCDFIQQGTRSTFSRKFWKNCSNKIISISCCKISILHAKFSTIPCNNMFEFSYESNFFLFNHCLLYVGGFIWSKTENLLTVAHYFFMSQHTRPSNYDIMENEYTQRNELIKTTKRVLLSIFLMF